MEKTETTIFENYLEESISLFNFYKGKNTSPETVLKTFFPLKFAEKVDLYHPIKNSKNALILVGQSCVGKTTFAQGFLKKHPDFTLVSMERCVGTELKSMAQEKTNHDINADTIGNHSFGLELEANHQNIIVDGNWLHMNSRGALLKTLYDLNYRTCIFLIHPDTKLGINNISIWESNIRHRCMELIAAEVCNIPLYELLLGVDPIEEFAKKVGLPTQYVVAFLAHNPAFDLLLSEKDTERRQEFIDSNLLTQLEKKMFFFGADMLTILYSQSNPYI